MLYIVCNTHGHLQRAFSNRFGRSGQWPHKFNRPTRRNFHVRQLHRGRIKKKCYFPKCLLLISAGEKHQLWRECGVTCQSKPAETWWVSHCRGSGDQLAVHWNSSDIGTWLTAHHFSFFLRLITLFHRSRDSQTPSLLWLLLIWYMFFYFLNKTQLCSFYFLLQMIIFN